MAIYKRCQEVDLGATKNNISQQSERDLNPRSTDFKSGALTTRPRCLLKKTLTTGIRGYSRLLAGGIAGFTEQRTAFTRAQSAILKGRDQGAYTYPAFFRPGRDFNFRVQRALKVPYPRS